MAAEMAVIMSAERPREDGRLGVGEKDGDEERLVANLGEEYEKEGGEETVEEDQARWRRRGRRRRRPRRGTRGEREEAAGRSLAAIAARLREERRRREARRRGRELSLDERRERGLGRGRDGRDARGRVSAPRVASVEAVARGGASGGRTTLDASARGDARAGRQEGGRGGHGGHDDRAGRDELEPEGSRCRFDGRWGGRRDQARARRFEASWRPDKRRGMKSP